MLIRLFNWFVTPVLKTVLNIRSYMNTRHRVHWLQSSKQETFWNIVATLRQHCSNNNENTHIVIKPFARIRIRRRTVDCSAILDQSRQFSTMLGALRQRSALCCLAAARRRAGHSRLRLFISALVGVPSYLSLRILSLVRARARALNFKRVPKCFHRILTWTNNTITSERKRGTSRGDSRRRSACRAFSSFIHYDFTTFADSRPENGNFWMDTNYLPSLVPIHFVTSMFTNAWPSRRFPRYHRLRDHGRNL